MKLEQFFYQFYCLVIDYKKQCGSKKTRMLYLWLTRAFIGVFLYRLERAFYLLLGKVYRYVRILLYPVYLPLYAYSNLEISYLSKIGPGISVLHPAMGITISGYAVIGDNLTLVGGNVIGTRPQINNGDPFILGSNLSLGANAVVLGPIVLGDNLTVDAVQW